MVTDFVWWEDRPNVAILLFESKDKTDYIIKASSCDNFRKISISDSQYVQVKNGSDLLELEWLSILPPKNHKSPLSTLAAKGNIDHLSENQITLTNRQDDSLALPLTTEENSVQITKIEVLEANEIDAPPTPKRRRDTDDNNNGFVELEIKSSELISNQVNQPALLPTNPSLSITSQDISPAFPWTRAKHPLQFEYWTIRKALIFPDPPLKICTVKVEEQVSRMFNYLCEFDLRSRYLITLVTTWLSLNSINLTEQVDSDNRDTIQWLVIFFLCVKSYIPTLRQILLKNPDIIKVKDEFTIGFHSDPTFVEEWKSQKKKNLVYLKNKRNKQDTSYCIPLDEYSDKFLLSVFQLLWKFLNFYESTWAGGNEPVASLLDGQIIDIRQLLQPVHFNLSETLETKGPTFWGNIMSTEEIDTLVSAVKRERAFEEFCGVYLTHPLNLSLNICLANDIKISFKHFGNGYPIIKSFVERVEQVGVKIGLMEFGGLQKVLTFKKKDWVTILKKRIIVTRKM